MSKSPIILIEYPKPQNEAEEQAKRQAVRDAYKKAHAVCPKCGSSNYESTCMGFPDEGPDGNRITCGCGWRGRRHACVPAFSTEDQLNAAARKAVDLYLNTPGFVFVDGCDAARKQQEVNKYHRRRWRDNFVNAIEEYRKLKNHE